MVEDSLGCTFNDHWNLNSDPPEVQYSDSSFNEKTPTKSIMMQSETSGNVSEEILSNRKDYYRDIFPSFSSSPIHSHSRQKREQDDQLKRIRTYRRDKNTLKMRGGIEKMENFVMKSEQQEEERRLRKQALDYEIPEELIEQLEKEQQEDLEDDDIFQYIDQREQWEQELDQILSELIIS